jgi:histidyl-tRNA synthetase
MLTQGPKGTKDVLPGEAYKWQHVEKITSDVCRVCGYKQIRTPVFEHTELFERGVGDGTDIVQKEMYTFNDKGGRSITLRPEGTAGVVRSYIEHGMGSLPTPVKMFYYTTCYRYEKAQKGRYREHNQFGVEALGAKGPDIDVEIISLGYMVLKKAGITDNIELQINSIGCPECRKEFMKHFKAFMKERKEGLCETCKDRLEKNPMRILDCKENRCRELIRGCPVMVDYLCDECRSHFDGLKEGLTNIGIEFSINTSIVRGQDYYSKTVFEFINTKGESQNAVCAGGRYDGLVGVCGGTPTPGIGFGMGIERLIMCMEDNGVSFPSDQNTPDIYFANIGEEAGIYTGRLVYKLRMKGFIAEKDLAGRSLKAQMKYADKLKARFSVVVGENEINTQNANLKNMQTGEQKEIDLNDLELYLSAGNAVGV